MYHARIQDGRKVCTAPLELQACIAEDMRWILSVTDTMISVWLCQPLGKDMQGDFNMITQATCALHAPPRADYKAGRHCANTQTFGSAPCSIIAEQTVHQLLHHGPLGHLLHHRRHAAAAACRGWGGAPPRGDTVR